MKINSGIENYLKNATQINKNPEEVSQKTSQNKENTKQNNEDKVTLSEAAKTKLNDYKLNQEKIESLKVSIENKEYSMNSDKIADKIINFEKTLFE